MHIQFFLAIYYDAFSTFEQYFNQLILIHAIKTGHNNVNKWLFSNIHDTLQDSKWI